MDSARNLSNQDATQYRHQFEIALSWVSRVFGNESFRQFQIGNINRSSGQWGSRRYDLIYEIQMVGFAQFGDSLEKIWNSLDPTHQILFINIIRNRFINVATTERFLDSINQGTTRTEAINARFEPWLQALKNITTGYHNMIDDADFIQKRINESSLCALCPYPVSSDDAVCILDKNEKKIVHRFCNQNR